jgi:hypothetical protein
MAAKVTHGGDSLAPVDEWRTETRAGEGHSAMWAGSGASCSPLQKASQVRMGE